MNALEMLRDVKHHLNRAQSPRFDEDRISWALKTYQRTYVNDRIDNIKKSIREKRYSFESAQRIIDSLYTIVKKSSIPFVNNTIGYPTDYYYQIGLQATINGKLLTSTPAMISEITGNIENIYERPDEDYLRHITHDSIIQIYYGGKQVTLGANATFWYITKFNDINISEQSYVAGDTLTVGDVMVVNEYDPITYNSIIYQPYQQFTVITGFLTFTGTGNVKKVINSQLPVQSHDEIVLGAAKLLSGVVENYDRFKVKSVEANES